MAYDEHASQVSFVVRGRCRPVRTAELRTTAGLAAHSSL